MSKSYNTSIENRSGCLWTTFKDSIDMDNHKVIEDSVFQKIKECTSQDVVIDLSKTTALFSSGVGVIMRIHSIAQDHHKKLSLVNVSDKVRDGLETMGLDRVLSIYSTTNEFQSDNNNSSE